LHSGCHFFYLLYLSDYKESRHPRRRRTQPRASRQDPHKAPTSRSSTNPPTDLDVNTLRALEEAITEFAGVALVVSHDRWFLDRICTHLTVFEGDSVAKMYVGTWSDYETMMQENTGRT
jgi:hypothetical protein